MKCRHYVLYDKLAPSILKMLQEIKTVKAFQGS